MALATQCPHCRTTFRVVHDQLKLRAGLVRCGSCKQIFNGIEHLLRPDQVPPHLAKNPQHPVVAPAAVTTVTAHAMPEDSLTLQTVPDTTPTTVQPAPSENDFIAINDPADHLPPSSIEPFIHADAEIASSDPLQRMTLMDFTYVEEPDASEAADQSFAASPTIEAGDADRPSDPATESTTPDELDRAIEDLQQKPWRSDNKSSEHDSADDLVAAEEDEPDFVTLGRRRQRMGRILRTFMWTASVFLLLALIGQSAYVFRNQLAARFPEIKQELTMACQLIDCQVTLPTQIDAVSIESSELQALAIQKNTFALTLLLRNYGPTAQTWPHIELTLNDVNEKAIVRKVFTPSDYLLPPQDLPHGFAPNSEHAVKIPFELLELKASGYRVYLYYP